MDAAGGGGAHVSCWVAAAGWGTCQRLTPGAVSRLGFPVGTGRFSGNYRVGARRLEVTGGLAGGQLSKPGWAEGLAHLVDTTKGLAGPGPSASSQLPRQRHAEGQVRVREADHQLAHGAPARAAAGEGGRTAVGGARGPNTSGPAPRQPAFNAPRPAKPPPCQPNPTPATQPNASNPTQRQQPNPTQPQPNQTQPQPNPLARHVRARLHPQGHGHGAGPVELGLELPPGALRGQAHLMGWGGAREGGVSRPGCGL